MKQALIEGWRGISQSFAMVNQYQLVELARLDGICLSHLDLPFSNPAWTEAANAPSFPPEMQEVIKSVPAPCGQDFDVAFNISFPFRRPVTPARRALTFMTGEFGLLPTSFHGGVTEVDRICHDDDLVVVPSSWSRMKVVEYGFREDKVVVVPHGVSSGIFHPADAREREEVRRQIGLSSGDFVFLNVGAMTWNKGIDILLRAFVQVRRRHPSARLVLKDASTLYGIRGSNVVATFVQESGGLGQDLLDSIKIISSGLPLYQMRLLYGAADVYVSPYRAEGFNLPVIEAIACGAPAIVTDGGATDDFCDSTTAWRVASDRVENADKGIPGRGYHLEPRLDCLIDAMEASVSAGRALTAGFDAGRRRLVERFSWSEVVQQLVRRF